MPKCLNFTSLQLSALHDDTKGLYFVAIKELATIFKIKHTETGTPRHTDSSSRTLKLRTAVCEPGVRVPVCFSFSKVYTSNMRLRSKLIIEAASKLFICFLAQLGYYPVKKSHRVNCSLRVYHPEQQLQFLALVSWGWKNGTAVSLPSENWGWKMHGIVLFYL